MEKFKCNSPFSERERERAKRMYCTYVYILYTLQPRTPFFSISNGGGSAASS